MAETTTVGTDTYNYKVVRQFAIMTIVWGLVGMTVGVYIAAELAWPWLNFDIPYITFSRLRPLHTNTVIFAFGGSALFATSYYVVQRTCHVRLISDRLAGFTFWAWQLVIVLAAITLPLGLTSTKEYAELEWPIDLLIAAVWITYAIVFFGTIVKRKVPHIYVANWFYGAFIITIAILHIFNNLAIPVSMWKSYSAYAGVQDAMVQWWYGHNAVPQCGRVFLNRRLFGHDVLFCAKASATAGVFLPFVHCSLLGLDFHLHLGRPPSLTLHRLTRLDTNYRHGDVSDSAGTLLGRYDFSFYGMSTFEGPMMAIKTVNALSHYTDWTIGHVHSGALGWVAMISMGSLYYLIPRIFGRELYSLKLVEVHFWSATIGVVLYITAMWVSGIMQGLMWRAVNPDGTLTYSFVESVQAMHPYYVIRWLGGVLFLLGMVIMAYNVFKTVTSSKVTEVNDTIPAPAFAH